MPDLDIQETMERDDYLEGWQECRKELVRCRWVAMEFCEGGSVGKLEDLLGMSSKEIEQDMRRLNEQEAARMEQND